MRKLIPKPLLAGTVIALVGLLLATILVAVLGNNYRYSQRSVMIPGPAGKLAGVLTSPDKKPARGLVVMVHGDGPVNADQDGLYDPWFEGAADAGYATVSWNKPGIGDSEDNWLDQTMDDRAQEVSAVIDWAQHDSEIPTQSIVIWGASQAGWVVPKVTRIRHDIDAVVAVAPAINWLRQGRYNLDADLADNGATEQEIRQAKQESDQTRELLERGASYAEYRDHIADSEPMDEQRWRFVMKNFTADSETDLKASSEKNTPIHLMVGTRDRNVDVRETEDTYSRNFGAHLSVTHFNGAHSLARPVMEDNELVGLFTAVVWPRALLAPGVISDYTHFLSTFDQ